MVSLDGTRTGANLRHALSEEELFDRLYLNQEQAAREAGLLDLAALPRAAAARFASGHLDYLVAGNDGAAPSRMSPREFAAEMTATIDDHTAMCAGMARTARDEGFEDIAGWFETLAKAGRSHAQRMRRVVRKHEDTT